VDTEDDLQPLVASAFRDARRAVALVATTMARAEFNVARMLERAHEGWVTITELADVLVREEGLSFRAAHAITSTLARTERADDPEAVTAALRQAAAD
jgi:argininosuccinate lyase